MCGCVWVDCMREILLTWELVASCCSRCAHSAARRSLFLTWCLCLAFSLAAVCLSCMEKAHARSAFNKANNRCSYNTTQHTAHSTQRVSQRYAYQWLTVGQRPGMA
jgi:hypothetical protein